jgi:serine/threonine protein kinase
VHQVHDTVSNVEAPGGYLDGIAVFKSGVASFDHTYHELRFLLTVPPHAFIMPRPLAIVTKKAVFGAKRGVVGFLFRHFPAGSIRDILPSRQRTRTLSNEVKLKWSRQAIAAMLHIHESVGSFYSDLRPDNALLDEDGDNVVLCDFEQRGN